MTKTAASSSPASNPHGGGPSASATPAVEAARQVDGLRHSVAVDVIAWFEALEKSERADERLVDSALTSSLDALHRFTHGLLQFTKTAVAGGAGGSSELQSFASNLRPICERIDRIAPELSRAIPGTTRSFDARLSSLKVETRNLFDLASQSATSLKDFEQQLEQMLAKVDAALEVARHDIQSRNAAFEQMVSGAKKAVQQAEQSQASRKDLTSTVYSVWTWAVGLALAIQVARQSGPFSAVGPLIGWLVVAWLLRKPSLPLFSAIIAGLRRVPTPSQAAARLGATEAEVVAGRELLRKDEAASTARRNANGEALRLDFRNARRTLLVNLDAAATRAQSLANAVQREAVPAASSELKAKQLRARQELAHRIDQIRAQLDRLQSTLNPKGSGPELRAHLFRAESQQAVTVGTSIGRLPAEVAAVWGANTLVIPRVLDPGWAGLVFDASLPSAQHSSAALANDVLFKVLRSTPPTRLAATVFDTLLGGGIRPFLPLVESGLPSAPEVHLAGSRKAFDERIDATLDEIRKSNVAVAKSKVGGAKGSVGIDASQTHRWHLFVIHGFPTDLDKQLVEKLIILADAVKSGQGALVVSCTNDLGRPLDAVEKRFLQRLEPTTGREGVWEIAPSQPLRESEIGDAVAEGCRNLAARADHARERIAREGKERIFALDFSRSSAEGLEFEVGMDDRGRLAHLRFGFDPTSNSALLIGSSGSGKSTFLHTIILNGALHYTPLEFQLYLFDFKKGVEFERYARLKLPHAAVVSLRSDRDFVINCLQEIESRFERRAAEFNKVGAGKLSEYRESQAKVPTELRNYAPRYLIIIDEFQELFTGTPRQAAAAGKVLDQLVRQGRSFGCHLILSTQNLGGSVTLPPSLLRLFTMKIAMKSDPKDILALLDDEQISPKLRTAGDAAILPGGYGEKYSIVHTPNVTNEIATGLLLQVTKRLGRAKNIKTFDDQRYGVLSHNAAFVELDALSGRASLEAGAVPILLGEPLSLQPVTRAELRREPRHNILTISQERDDVQAIWLAAVWSLSRQRPKPLSLTFLLPQDRYHLVDEALEAPGLKSLGILVARELASQVRALSTLASRTTDQSRQFLLVADPTLLNWPQGARNSGVPSRRLPAGIEADLDPRDLLTDLLTRGSERGIHVLCFFEGLARIQALLGREFPTHFAFRVTGRIDEQEARSALIDSSVLALQAGRFILRDEGSKADPVQFRAFNPSQPPMPSDTVGDK